MKKNMKMLAIVAVTLGVIIGAIAVRNFFIPKTQGTQMTQQIKYWTCGMHPSVRISDEEYKKGKKTCPICNMNLIPAAGIEEAPQKEKAAESKPSAQHVYYGCGVKEEGHCPHCDEGTPDAKCICGGHSFLMSDKEMSCPVCGKALKKLEPEEVEKIDKNVVSRVKLNSQMIERGGIIVEPAKKYHMTKTIRTVGRIAFDPELAITEEEFLTALQTRQKVSESPDADVIARADDIVNKSKLKLRLLGLSDGEIKSIEESRSAQMSLVLPEKEAWVYADIYEYDIGWVKEGQEVKVTAVAFPGEEFKGVIRSISPVLDPMTRSVRARIEIANPEKKLKPEMYVDVVIESIYISPAGEDEVLAVPKEALLDTGTRKLVYVDAGGGQYLGKEVKVGPEAVALVQAKEVRLYPILGGMSEGELFVTKGNFLIDSQSQLTGGMSVLWGAAQEIKSESAAPAGEATPPETKHRH